MPTEAPGAQAALFPAIDLRRGRCVRLQQGRADRETSYSSDPLSVAEAFREQGAEWVHVVDLDAAFGEGSNRELIRRIAGSAALRVQTGGGLRTLDAVEAALEAGAARAVIGTAAVEDPELAGEAVHRWGAERIAVGLDARGTRPALRGWTGESEADLFTLAATFAELGVRTLVYTDIERDGMLVGPNLEHATELARRSRADVVVSGGVSELADVRSVGRAARERRGISGLIVGKALYEGRFDLPAALQALRG